MTNTKLTPIQIEHRSILSKQKSMYEACTDRLIAIKAEITALEIEHDSVEAIKDDLPMLSRQEHMDSFHSHIERT